MDVPTAGVIEVTAACDTAKAVAEIEEVEMVERHSIRPAVEGDGGED